MITVRMMMKNGREASVECRTLAEARGVYRDNIRQIAYGAIYETNSREEEIEAERLFRESEAEMLRREREMANTPSAEELFLNALLNG